LGIDLLSRAQSRQRSWRWLPLAAAGPFGFMLIAMLEDRSPAPGDRISSSSGNSGSTGAFHWKSPSSSQSGFLRTSSSYSSATMIAYESFSTGTPAATIIAAEHPAAYGRQARMEQIYLLTLVICSGRAFNLVGHLSNCENSVMARINPERLLADLRHLPHRRTGHRRRAPAFRRRTWRHGAG
jgi:hypothetical protein